MIKLKTMTTKASVEIIYYATDESIQKKYDYFEALGNVSDTNIKKHFYADNVIKTTIKSVTRHQTEFEVDKLALGRLIYGE